MSTPAHRDISESLREQIRAAVQTGQPLNIVGGNSKPFLGRARSGTPLETGRHRGIVHYDPAELILTVRAGTPLAEVEAALSEAGQMLAFEPPDFDGRATIGGTIACNLSGPRRPYSGAARDFLLGVRIINGQGEILRFGGEVMKNVAGYDVSRLMAGAHGTLGVLLEVSLKVLPRPASTLTLVQHCGSAEALSRMNRWAAKAVPLAGACYDGDCLFLRLEGAETAVNAARKTIGGELADHNGQWWRDIANHRHGFFRHARSLRRISVKATTPPATLPGKWFIEWGGALRWYDGDIDDPTLQTWARSAHGHSLWWRYPPGTTLDSPFPPLTQPSLRLHQRLKQAFDPAGILNPGRLYPDW